MEKTEISGTVLKVAEVRQRGTVLKVAELRQKGLSLKIAETIAKFLKNLYNRNR